MKAVEFVKKFGWEEAKNIVDASEIIGIDRNIVDINQLKRLVESHELVEKYGADKINQKIKFLESIHLLTQANQLKKAIADVESCK